MAWIWDGMGWGAVSLLSHLFLLSVPLSQLPCCFCPPFKQFCLRIVMSENFSFVLWWMKHGLVEWSAMGGGGWYDGMKGVKDFLCLGTWLRKSEDGKTVHWLCLLTDLLYFFQRDSAVHNTQPDPPKTYGLVMERWSWGQPCVMLSWYSYREAHP